MLRPRLARYRQQVPGPNHPNPNPNPAGLLDRRTLAPTTPTLTLQVCSTDDEHLVVRFELSTLDSEPGLVAYMNIFARTNEVVAKYNLKKVVEDWNASPHVERATCHEPGA